METQNSWYSTLNNNDGITFLHYHAHPKVTIANPWIWIFSFVCTLFHFLQSTFLYGKFHIKICKYKLKHTKPLRIILQRNFKHEYMSINFLIKVFILSTYIISILGIQSFFNNEHISLTILFLGFHPLKFISKTKIKISLH